LRLSLSKFYSEIGRRCKSLTLRPFGSWLAIWDDFRNWLISAA